MKSIVVFCGSSPGKGTKYLEIASELGQFLGKNNITLIYGGATVGCMGAVANGALAAGGKVIGVIPQFIQDHEIAHHGLTELITVDSMHTRKLKMYELCDAAIALPGGFGTMDELFEMLTWQQLDLHQKPIGLLNVDGYYNGLLELLNSMEKSGLLRKTDKTRLTVSHEMESLVNYLLENDSPKNDPTIFSKV
ncbi:MAG: TIGR00730 family Rossman fold protein [Bacteroidetes bacterium]|nr:TIGR00730 family Rossman fold protein [Bacteroidota bacterium]